MSEFKQKPMADWKKLIEQEREKQKAGQQKKELKQVKPNTDTGNENKISRDDL